MYFTISLCFLSQGSEQGFNDLLREFCATRNLRYFQDFSNFAIVRTGNENLRAELYDILQGWSAQNRHEIRFVISPISTKQGFGGNLNSQESWNELWRITNVVPNSTNW